MKKILKLRRRAANWILCLLAAAVAVAAVGAADALESRFAARIDLSFNSVTTRSEAWQRGDTSVVIQTRTVESYDASKKL